MNKMTEITKIYCDKCKKEIDTHTNYISLYEFGDFNDYRRIHLCKSCFKRFKRWLNENR